MIEIHAPRKQSIFKAHRPGGGPDAGNNGAAPGGTAEQRKNAARKGDDRLNRTERFPPQAANAA